MPHDLKTEAGSVALPRHKESIKEKQCNELLHGTQIAYDKLGKGPAVILVNGALAPRSGRPGPRCQSESAGANLGEVLQLTDPVAMRYEPRR